MQLCYPHYWPTAPPFDVPAWQLPKQDRDLGEMLPPQRNDADIPHYPLPQWAISSTTQQLLVG